MKTCRGSPGSCTFQVLPDIDVESREMMTEATATCGKVRQTFHD